MSQLTIVVTCTSRKLAPSTPLRLVRNLPDTTVEERLGMWIDRGSARGQGDPVQLKDLYRGDNWLQTQSLLTMVSERVGTEALVASAGLGLRELSDEHAPYDATFSQLHPDTVARAHRTDQWWQALTAQTGGGLERITTPQVLLVLSEPYARALHPQIEELAASGKDVVLCGGWRDIDGIRRVRADRQLRNALGGSVGSLLPRMARRWMNSWDGGSLASGEHVSIWERWSLAARQHERYDRRRLSDAEVADFIRRILSEDPSMAATTSLRRLRESGQACEQRRFGAIFRQFKEARAS